MKYLIILMMIGAAIGSNSFNHHLQPVSGQLVLNITDYPGDLNITHANITISQVKVHRNTAANNTTAGWYTVVNKSQTFDLIVLQNVTEFFGSVNLSAGGYTQIRLVVEKVVLTVDGIEYNCKIPSNTIKLITPFNISANKKTNLTMDFDVQKSVHETGNNKFMFKPTIKIIQG
jgi:hypothetical protein